VDIGIIGAGRVGSSLARKLRGLGHRVTIANSRGPGTLATFAVETGAIARSVRQVARGADVVIVAIPEKSVVDLPAHLFEATLSDVIVVDAGNYAPQQRDGCIEPIEAGMAESRWVSERLGRPVVKAFNTIEAARLLAGGLPAGTPGRIGLPVAGDASAAKAQVMRLVDALGFDGVDAGSLDDSWRQQPGTPVYGADLDAAGVRAALAQATHERPSEWRATPGVLA
jgi:predicted dinucleotide-binding enzyme